MQYDKIFKENFVKTNMNKNYAIIIAIVAIAIVGSITFVIQNTDSIDSKTSKETIAKNMVKSAIANYDKNGEKSFDQFNDSDQYHNGEFYVFVISEKSEMVVSHGITPDYIGMTVSDFTDPIVKNWVESSIDKATFDGDWANYKFLNPDTNSIEPKSSWVVLHDGYIFGVGVYSP